MKHFLLASLTAIALFAAVVPSSAAKHWIDVTESTLVNPGFDEGTLKGWKREGAGYYTQTTLATNASVGISGGA